MIRPSSSYDMSKNTISFATINSYLRDKDVLIEHLYMVDTEKKCRKYFSKKLQKLIFLHQSSSWASNYHCKIVKQLRVYGTFPRKVPLRLLQAITFYSGKLSYSPMPNINQSARPSFMDNISDYKSLKVLNITASDNLISLAKLKTLANLQEISLKLSTCQQLVKDSAALLSLLNLRSLKKFTLSFYDMFYTDDLNPEVADFCLKLLGRKTLLFVGLDLSKISFKAELIEKLLGRLQEAKIPNFLVHLALENRMDLQKVQAALDYVDLMSFMLTKPNDLNISVNNSSSIEELGKPISQAKRRLKLTIFGNLGKSAKLQRTPDRKPFSLLGSLSYICREMDLEYLMFLDHLTAKKLRSFTLSFDKISQSEQEIVKAYVNILKNSPYLKELYLENLTIEYSEQAELYKPIFEEISNLKSLSSLTFNNFLFFKSYFKILQKPLGLTNLEQLTLKFKTHLHSHIQSHLGLSFRNLKRLRRLSLALPGLSRKSKVNFINDLTQLTELKVLEIAGWYQQSYDQEVPLRTRLLRVFSSLVNLESIVLISYGIVARRIDEFSKKNERQIKELFAQNPHLEFFRVTGLNPSDIRFIRV